MSEEKDKRHSMNLLGLCVRGNDVMTKERETSPIYKVHQRV